MREREREESISTHQLRSIDTQRSHGTTRENGGENEGEREREESISTHQLRNIDTQRSHGTTSAANQ